MAKEKLTGTEIQCRFGDSEICLNFRKEVGPLRNGETCFLQFWRSSVYVYEPIYSSRYRNENSNVIKLFFK